MGIPKYISFLDRRSDIETFRYISRPRSYDHVIFDFNSVIHTEYRPFASEYNMFIRIMFCLHFLIVENSTNFVLNKNLSRIDDLINSVNKILNSQSVYFEIIFDLCEVDIIRNESTIQLVEDIENFEEIEERIKIIFEKIVYLNIDIQNFIQEFYKLYKIVVEEKNDIRQNYEEIIKIIIELQNIINFHQKFFKNFFNKSEIFYFVNQENGDIVIKDILEISDLIIYLENFEKKIDSLKNHHVINYISDRVCEKTLDIIMKSLKNNTGDILSRSYIFIDNLPLTAKFIKTKGIGKALIKKIKRNLYNKTKIQLIERALLHEGPPEIGQNSPLILSIKKKFLELDPKYGRLNINEDKDIMDAEQQIIKLIRKDMIHNDILIYSQDSDTFLLCLLHGLWKVDILFEETKNEKNDDFNLWFYGKECSRDNIRNISLPTALPYKNDIYYYSIDKLGGCLSLKEENQKRYDLCFLILIIQGNDFLPRSEEFKSNIISELISRYGIIKNLYNKETKNTLNIIILKEKNTFEINWNHLKYFLRKFLMNFMKNKKIIRSWIDFRELNQKEVRRTCELLKKYYYYHQYLDYENFEKIYFLEKGFYLQGSEYINLVSEKNREELIIKYDCDVKCYIDGINFIFKMYFEQNIINKFWCYKKKRGPTFYEILNYLERNNLIVNFEEECSYENERASLTLHESGSYFNKDTFILLKRHVKEETMRLYIEKVREEIKQEILQEIILINDETSKENKIKRLRELFNIYPQEDVLKIVFNIDEKGVLQENCLCILLGLNNICVTELLINLLNKNRYLKEFYIELLNRMNITEKIKKESSYLETYLTYKNVPKIFKGTLYSIEDLGECEIPIVYNNEYILRYNEIQNRYIEIKKKKTNPEYYRYKMYIEEHPYIFNPGIEIPKIEFGLIINDYLV